jgi:hypothetical protein
VRRADKCTTFMRRVSLNLGASTSWKPQRLSSLLQGLLYKVALVMSLYHVDKTFFILMKKIQIPLFKTKFLTNKLINFQCYLHTREFLFKHLSGCYLCSLPSMVNKHQCCQGHYIFYVQEQEN